MTNAELIAALQKHPGDLEVVLELGWRYTAGISSIVVSEDADETGVYLYVSGDDVADPEEP